MTHLIDPYSQLWVEATLLPLAARARAGEEDGHLREELLAALWPWATREADRAACRLPSTADRNTTRSEVLLAVWQATQRVGWDSPQTWPALLRRRINGARVDAARRDDTLPKRMRAAHRELLQVVASTEQTEGRHLTVAERYRLAATLWPRSRPQWLHQVACGGDQTNDGEGHGWSGPEDELIGQERDADVRAWMTELPGDLADELRTWLDLPGRRSTLPSRLRLRLHPHLARLEPVLSDAS